MTMKGFTMATLTVMATILKMCFIDTIDIMGTKTESEVVDFLTTDTTCRQTRDSMVFVKDAVVLEIMRDIRSSSKDEASKGDYFASAEMDSDPTPSLNNDCLYS